METNYKVLKAEFEAACKKSLGNFLVNYHGASGEDDYYKIFSFDELNDLESEFNQSEDRVKEVYYLGGGSSFHEQYQRCRATKEAAIVAREKAQAANGKMSLQVWDAKCGSPSPFVVPARY